MMTVNGHVYPASPPAGAHWPLCWGVSSTPMLRADVSTPHCSLGGQLHFWALLDASVDLTDMINYQCYVWLSVRAWVLESGNIWFRFPACNPNYVAVSQAFNPLESLFSP